MSTEHFSRKELKFLVGVSSALGLRQLGLMLVLPFISLYGLTLQGNSPALIGFALGVYGLVQGCLQIPFGMLSDRFGRKPIVLAGLFQLIAGLIVAYFARSIYVFIFARALQGSGAINAAAFSWVGDNVEKSRNEKAMGVISAVIGAAVAASLIGGGILQRVLSIPQIFLLCAFLTVIAWFYILAVLKEDRKSLRQTRDTYEAKSKRRFDRETFFSVKLINFYIMGFIVNFLLIGMFYIFPQILDRIIGRDEMWKIFIPAVIAGIIAVRGVNVLSRKGRGKIVLPVSFCGLMIGILCLFRPDGIVLSLGIIVFFSAFICLNAQLTSGVNLAADEQKRGAVQGVANTIQFVGSFLGGTLTGALWGINRESSLIFIALVCIAGIYVSIRYARPVVQPNR